ncbi:MAG TPA: hypothetical protein VJX70_11415 [Candidatus Acidoferrum sp.]|nr:hypothetical protein [Candidatus Acidoferrum sp.]
MQGIPASQRSANDADGLLLDLGKASSFILTILSLCALLDSAFFVTATTWEDRLIASVARIGLAACVSFASGLLFHISEPKLPLTQTLPVRLFVYALLGFAVIFALAWFLDVFYVPLLWRNLPN